MKGEWRPKGPSEVYLYDAFRWTPTDENVYRDYKDRGGKFYGKYDPEEVPTADRVNRGCRDFDIDYATAGRWTHFKRGEEIASDKGIKDDRFHIMLHHPAAQGRVEFRLSFEDVQPFIDLIQRSWDEVKKDL